MALLWGLGVQTATAQVPYHQEILAGFSSLKAEIFSKPVLIDLDDDGDFDLVAGSVHPSPVYFENVGSPAVPRFIERRDEANPVADFETLANVSVDFGDLDGDGDFDAFVGSTFGTLSYFENVGSPTQPIFEERPADNPLDFVDVGQISEPEMVDIDGDDDLDVFVGRANSGIAYFENIGSPTSASFVEHVGSPNNPLHLPLDEVASVDLVDVDGDGDFDAVVGGELGRLSYYENIGSPTAPEFVERTGGANPFDAVDTMSRSNPQLADLDDDGDLDTLTGEGFGSFLYFENVGDADTPMMVEVPEGDNPFAGHRFAGFSHPELADLDGDGDLDAVLGAEAPSVRYFENVGSGLTPVFQRRTGPDNPFDQVDLGPGMSVELADLDADGDLDALVGATAGILAYFENVGDPQTPMFVELVGGDNPFDGITGLESGSPELADMDADGDLDALVSDASEFARYFENIGTPQTAQFIERTGEDNPLDLISLGDLPTLDSLDFDQDGDVDLVVGSLFGLVEYYRNTGSPEEANYVLVTDSPFLTIDAGRYSSPKIADLDGDGDLDALVGEQSGRFIFFRSTAIVPFFEDGFESGDTSAWSSTSPGS